MTSGNPPGMQPAIKPSDRGLIRPLLWVAGLLMFLIVSFPFSLIPYSLIRKTGGALGLLVHLLWKKRRLIALDNLRRAVEKNPLPEGLSVEAVIKENFRNLGRSFIEVLKIYYGTGGKILKSVSIEGVENFEAARKKGKGIMYIAGHCGNWELMAIAVSLKLDTVGVVARPLDNPYLNSLLETVRRKYGNTVISKKGALRTILRTLKRGGSVGILMDQAVVPEEGIIIDFLGRPAWTLKVPAIIARASSASVLPAFIRRTQNGHVITINPALELTGDETENTKRLSRPIEDYIRENPSEWLWIHRRWKRAGGQ